MKSTNHCKCLSAKLTSELQQTLICAGFRSKSVDVFLTSAREKKSLQGMQIELGFISTEEGGCFYKPFSFYFFRWLQVGWWVSEEASLRVQALRTQHFSHSTRYVETLGRLKLPRSIKLNRILHVVLILHALLPKEESEKKIFRVEPFYGISFLLSLPIFLLNKDEKYIIQLFYREYATSRFRRFC